MFFLVSLHFSLPFTFSVMMIYHFYDQKHEIEQNGISRIIGSKMNLGLATLCLLSGWGKMLASLTS